jgi:hypothetical protein
LKDEPLKKMGFIYCVHFTLSHSNKIWHATIYYIWIHNAWGLVYEGFLHVTITLCRVRVSRSSPRLCKYGQDKHLINRSSKSLNKRARSAWNQQLLDLIRNHTDNAPN